LYYTKIGLDGFDYQYKLTNTEIQTLINVENKIGEGVNINQNIAVFIFYLGKGCWIITQLNSMFP